MKDQVVFIDEFPENVSYITYKIKFLRELCRVISTKNSSNIIDVMSDHVRSDSCSMEPSQPQPWVQVMVKTAKATIQSLSATIKIQNHKGNLIKLANYISKSDQNDLDYDRFFGALFGNEANTEKWPLIKKLVQFFILQSRTSLPGMISFFLNHLFQIIRTYKDDPKKLWLELNEKLVRSLGHQEHSISSIYGRLASAHSLVFDTPLKSLIGKGYFAEKFVENQFYRFGEKGEIMFQLDIALDDDEDDDYYNEFFLFRDGSRYYESCHSLEIDEDFFTMFFCLNSLNRYHLYSDHFSDQSKKFMSIAGLFSKYVTEFSASKFVFEADESILKCLSHEILANWSICHASHQNFNGETGGKQVFNEFVKQIQIFDEISSVIFKGLAELPTNLNDILNRIKVPYLMRFPTNNSTEAKQNLEFFIGDFIKLGESRVPENKIGFDVIFDIEFDGITRTGFIECELWSQAADQSNLFKYYKKACDEKYPLTFLICKSVEMLSENLPVTFDKLWDVDENHIDIYCIKLETEAFYNHYEANFTIYPLKTFENSKGAFVVIESRYQTLHEELKTLK